MIVSFESNHNYKNNKLFLDKDHRKVVESLHLGSFTLKSDVDRNNQLMFDALCLIEKYYSLLLNAYSLGDKIVELINYDSDEGLIYAVEQWKEFRNT